MTVVVDAGWDVPAECPVHRRVGVLLEEGGGLLKIWGGNGEAVLNVPQGVARLRRQVGAQGHVRSDRCGWRRPDLELVLGADRVVAR
jgi:hypothetical protein